MKTAPQASADHTRLAELIEDMSIAMLATVAPDGSLSSRPMAVLEMDAQGALWFFIDLRSPMVGQLRAVNLSFTDNGGGTFVSLSGRGEIDIDRGRIERLWPVFGKQWFADGPDSPHLALLKFVPDVADYWDERNIAMVRAFAAIAPSGGRKPVVPIATGRPGSYNGLPAALAAGAAR